MSLLGQQKLIGTVNQSEVKITGTSSLHDWVEFAQEFTVSGVKEDQKITNLEIKIKTTSIESGHSSIMDGKTHEALKAQKFPVIMLRANELVISENKSIQGNGTLHIAGKEKAVPITTVIKDNGQDTLEVTGSIDIVMSEYGIDPPTAMFGTLTTGDKVTVHYAFNLKYQ
jgi:polyisoprenoid-binding protein YceI